MERPLVEPLEVIEERMSRLGDEETRSRRDKRPDSLTMSRANHFVAILPGGDPDASRAAERTWPIGSYKDHRSSALPQ